MTKKISHLWREQKQLGRSLLHNSFFQNATSLYLIQLAQYLLPLITVPYLVRVLGPSGYGTVVFGQSFITYFLLLTDFGFNFSATRDISVNRHDIVKVSSTVFHVWAAKAFLCLAGLIILMICVTYVPKLNELSSLLLIMYAWVVGNTIFPRWLFQGMDKLVFVSVMNLATQIFVLGGIFILVRQPNDYILYAGLQSVGALAAGIIAAFAAFKMFRLIPVMPTRNGVWHSLRTSRNMFFTTAPTNLLRTGNAFILGLFADSTIVGYYGAADRIVKLMVGLLWPISQAAYPRSSKLGSESKRKTLIWGRQLIISVGAVGLALSVFLFIGASLIVRIVLGPAFEPSILILQILAPLPFIIGIGDVMVIQIMFPFAFEKPAVFIVLMAVVLYFALAFAIVPLWYASGMALTALIIEIFITSGYFVCLYRNRSTPFHISTYEDNS